MPNDAIQLELPFPIKEIDRDGITMGVLSDGSPYLTARGLARMCGTDHSVILRLSANWAEEQTRPRGMKIAQLLTQHGFDGTQLYTRTLGQGGETHAYCDAVCMSLLEYYAFEAPQGDNTIALRNYRLLARSSFRDFIYSTVGYNPNIRLAESWRNFEERILLNASVPIGYFSIFREMGDFIVQLIRGGIVINDHTVPDISVGKVWGKYWTDNELDKTYGCRIRHPHFYPENYPQAQAEIYAWIYPDNALPIFRRWLYGEYTSKRFEAYLQNKASAGAIEAGNIPVMLEAVSQRNDILPGTMTGKQLEGVRIKLQNLPNK